MIKHSKPSKEINFFILTLLVVYVGNSQDFFRVGTGFSFKDSTEFVQTFNFDFNRTENIKEKAGKSLFRSRRGYYLTPTSDVNFGEGTTSSENNVLATLAFGKLNLGDLTNRNLIQSQYNQALEFSLSYNSDKNFDESLLFMRTSYIFSFLKSEFTGSDPVKDYVRYGSSFSISPFLNLGNRFSDSRTNSFYSVIGSQLDFKFRFLKKNKDNDPEENWIVKFSVRGYYLLAEDDELFNRNFSGKFFGSIDKKLIDKIMMTLSYKIGNDSPVYNDFNVLELGLKVKY
ncbi:MAG: hypothetical protein AB3N18_13380 [Allomuricauda sp.]